MTALVGLADRTARADTPARRAPTGVLYVDADASGSNDGSSWANAYPDLQDALVAAQAGDEVWVAAGVYTPTAGITRTATFSLVNGVALYGGFAGTESSRDQRDWQTNLTVLSGDIDGDDTDDDGNGIAETAGDIQGANAYHVLSGSVLSASAVLDGFTITAGKADGDAPHWRGGGMYNDAGSPTLTNVTFSGNMASSGGGMYSYDGNPTLTNVTFSGNRALSHGGGMYSRGSPALTNVIFSGNWTSNSSGGMLNSGSSTLTNVIFSGNRTPGRGGGMSNTGNPTLTNVTFSGNMAGQFGGLVNWDSPTLVNCILWGNEGEQIGGDGTPIVTYSDVQLPSGVYTGTGNINADPLFAAPISATLAPTTTGNYRPQVRSPTIDAGDNNAVAGVTTDLDGNPRIAGTVDMGAYEMNYFLYLMLVFKND